MLPIAMLGGIIFYPWMGMIQFLSPYLIFGMLFITYSRLDFRHIRLGQFQWILLGVQMILAALIYLSLVWVDHTLAEGVFICVFIPTATAAPVICAMLGGSLSKLATYSLLCNVVVAFVGPVILALIGDSQYGFIESFVIIFNKVMPLLIGPLALSFVLRRLCPNFHKMVINHQSISFYMWALSLFIIVGGCVSFIITHLNPDYIWTMIGLSFGSLAVCLLQFKIGRIVGRRYGDAVSGGQGLGQKNTVLAVWMALTYMNPIASVGPAAYIAWQNIVNSWQLMRHHQHSPST